MGVMKVLPFFGTHFNSLLPILLLIHCLLIYLNVWKKLSNQFVPARYQFCENEADDDHSSKGRLLLFKEQEAIEQGKKIGEILGITTHPRESDLPSSLTPNETNFSRRTSLDAPLAHVEVSQPSTNKQYRDS